MGDGGIDADHQVQGLDKGGGVGEIGKLVGEIGQQAAGKIAPLVIAAEDITYGNIGASSLIEARDHVGSDEAGPAGDQQHRRRDTT